MAAVLLAGLAAAADYGACFFKSKSDGCPDGFERIKLSDFAQFNATRVSDRAHFTFVALDDMIDSHGSGLFFEFEHLRRGDGAPISVEITSSGDRKQCFLDVSEGVYTDIVNNLTLYNMEVHTEGSDDAFVFTDLGLRHTTFVGRTDCALTVREELLADALSLNSFGLCHARRLVLEVTSGWPAANPRRPVSRSSCRAPQWPPKAYGARAFWLGRSGPRSKTTANSVTAARHEARVSSIGKCAGAKNASLAPSSGGPRKRRRRARRPPGRPRGRAPLRP